MKWSEGGQEGRGNVPLRLSVPSPLAHSPGGLLQLPPTHTHLCPRPHSSPALQPRQRTAQRPASAAQRSPAGTVPSEAGRH